MKAERVTNKLHAQLQHFLACILTLKAHFSVAKSCTFSPNISLFFLIVQLISHHRLVIMMYMCGNVGFSDGNIPVCMQIHNNACRLCPCRRLKGER